MNDRQTIACCVFFLGFAISVAGLLMWVTTGHHAYWLVIIGGIGGMLFDRDAFD